MPVARHTPGTFFSSPVYDTWYECVIMPLCSSPASGMVPNVIPDDTWYECVIMPLCSSPASGMVPNVIPDRYVAYISV